MLEFSLLCKQEDIRDNFEKQFPLWAHVVCRYCKDTQIRSSALQCETEDYSDEVDEGIIVGVISRVCAGYQNLMLINAQCMCG